MAGPRLRMTRDGSVHTCTSAKILVDQRLNPLIKSRQFFRTNVLVELAEGILELLATFRQQVLIAAGRVFDLRRRRQRHIEHARKLAQAMPAKAHVANLVGQVAAQAHVQPIDVEQNQALETALGVPLEKLDQLLGHVVLVHAAASELP